MRNEKYRMANYEISRCHQHDVQADDDEGTNGDVGDDGGFEAVQNFAAIKYTKEEADVNRVEEGNV